MVEIKQDESGFYYAVTNKSGCWKNWSQVDPIEGHYYPYEDHILNNAEKIYNLLDYNGWKHKPICAVLGNMIAESTMNPAQGEINKKYLAQYGYGLCQWTPATDYSDWAKNENHNVYYGTFQIEYLVETISDYWIIDPNYPYNITWEDFISYTGTEYDVEWLTMAFFINYERGTALEDYRKSSATYYDTYFGTYTPEQPIIPDRAPYHRYRMYGMPLWMALKKRREELY